MNTLDRWRRRRSFAEKNWFARSTQRMHELGQFFWTMILGRKFVRCGPSRLIHPRRSHENDTERTEPFESRLQRAWLAKKNLVGVRIFWTWTETVSGRQGVPRIGTSKSMEDR